jgi:hypothetical protein
MRVFEALEGVQDIFFFNQYLTCSLLYLETDLLLHGLYLFIQGVTAAFAVIYLYYRDDPVVVFSHPHVAFSYERHDLVVFTLHDCAHRVHLVGQSGPLDDLEASSDVLAQADARAYGKDRELG